MNGNKNYIEETNRFINETRQGNYSGSDFQIQQWQELRYDLYIVEDVVYIGDSVMLYGLSS